MKSAYNLETLKFIGNYPLLELPENCAFATENYQLQFIVGKWNGDEWIEGATPEEITEVNKLKIKDLKNQQYQEMQLTDWYFTRYIETGQEVPLEIISLRQDIRNKYDNLINEINNE